MDRPYRPIIFSTVAICLAVLAFVSMYHSSDTSSPLQLDQQDEIEHFISTNHYPAGDLRSAIQIRPIALNFEPPPLPSMGVEHFDEDTNHNAFEADVDLNEIATNSALKLLPPTTYETPNSPSAEMSILRNHKLQRLPPLVDATEMLPVASVQSQQPESNDIYESESRDAPPVEGMRSEPIELVMPTLPSPSSPSIQDEVWNEIDNPSQSKNRFANNDFVPRDGSSTPQESEPWGRSEDRQQGFDADLSPTDPTISGSPSSGSASLNQSIVRIPLPAESNPLAPNQADILPVERTENRAMSVVTNRADEIIKHGHSLATRNAPYYARAEFIVALRAVAEALDAFEGSSDHAHSLDAGLRALHEAEDFVANSSEYSINAYQVAQTHQTPLLKNSVDTNVSPIIARQRYYTYAQNKFAACCQSDAAGSRALYGLGKLYSTQALRANDTMMMNGPKAIVFHRAAMMVDPQNYLAANELGVMLGKYGELEMAREVLLHCLAIEQLPEAWYNLSIVHKKLGEEDLARRAQYEWQLTMRNRNERAHQAGTDSMDLIRWVDSNNFARVPTSTANHHTPPNRPAPQASHTDLNRQSDRRATGRRSNVSS